MSKRVTMDHIAQTAGVSRTTVSFVLNNVPDAKIRLETRQRILDVARELNYVPDSAATSLASGRAGTIALLARRSTHQLVSDRFLLQVLLGISAAVQAGGFHVLIEPLDPADPTATYSKLVRSGRVDGVLVWGPRMDDDEIGQIHADGFPIVVIGRLPGSEVPSVGFDNINGARLAVQHLIGLGHRRIACITEASPDYLSSSDRLMGYQMALEEAGIAYHEHLVRHADFTDEDSTRVVMDLFRSEPHPTAVFAGSDVVALGALIAFRAMQNIRVPQDVALVGFGDIPLAEYVAPPLTSMRVPAFDLGFTAGEMLTRLIANPDIPVTSAILTTELIIRETCGANLVQPKGLT